MNLQQALTEAQRRATVMQQAYAVYQRSTRAGDYMVRVLGGAPPKGWKRIAIYGEGMDALRQVAENLK